MLMFFTLKSLSPSSSSHLPGCSTPINRYYLVLNLTHVPSQMFLTRACPFYHLANLKTCWSLIVQMLSQVMLDLCFSEEALKRQFSIPSVKNIFIAGKKIMPLCLLKKLSVVCYNDEVFTTTVSRKQLELLC